jgi:hypothetical protein
MKPCHLNLPVSPDRHSVLSAKRGSCRTSRYITAHPIFFGGGVLDSLKGVCSMSFTCRVSPCLLALILSLIGPAPAQSRLAIRKERRALISQPGAGKAKPTKTEALRQAALKLMNNSETRHPFYWAGFILVGDGRGCSSPFVSAS